VLVQQDRDTKGEVIVLRGHHGVFSIQLPLAGGYFDVNFATCFVPAPTALGDDQRELSAMLTKCTIASLDGQSIVLFPEAEST
jgi:hypothetical protein